MRLRSQTALSICLCGYLAGTQMSASAFTLTPRVKIPPSTVMYTNSLPSTSTTDAVVDAVGEVSDVKMRLNVTRMDTFRKYAQSFCNLFPVWTVLTAATALKKPSVYLGIPPSTFPAQYVDSFGFFIDLILAKPNVFS